MAYALHSRIGGLLFAAGTCFAAIGLGTFSASAIDETEFLCPVVIEENQIVQTGDAVLPSEIAEDGWYTGTDGALYYCYADGSYATGITTLYDGETYLFALDGTLKTGWQSINGVRFYFDTTGQKQFGWISYSDRLYYVTEETGKQIGEVWIDGTPYEFDEFGVLQTGVFVCEDGTVAGCDVDATPYTGWITTDDGAVYYFEENGIAETGLCEIEGTTYFFNENGIMQTGWVTLEDGSTYYFDETGARQTGWLTQDDATYYLDLETGLMATGTVTLPDGTYEFDETGAFLQKQVTGIAYDVPYYNQADPQWGATYIGTKTIAQVGCLVTDLAMTESYYTGTEILPDEMRYQLKFDNNSLLWAPVIAMGYTIESCSGLSATSFYQRLYTLVSEYGPTIVGCDNAYGGSHYVVVTGCTNTDTSTLQASDFTINDPGFSSKTTLDEHLASYSKWFHFYFKSN
jgi:glucan-binding YG repeat protein